jgi:hypothetical protein
MAWKKAGHLPKGLYDHASAVWNDRLYVSGGFGSGSLVNTREIYIYEILPDSTLDPLIRVAYIPDKQLVLSSTEGVVEAEVLGLDGHAMFAHNGFLYIVGGKFQYVRTDCYPQSNVPCFNPTPTAWNRAVFYAPLQADGMIGPWTEVAFPSSVSIGIYTPGVAVYNDTVYVAGGWDGVKLTNTNTIISAALAPDGSLSEWREENPFPRGRSKHAVIAAKGHLYVIGGNTGGAVTRDGYTQGYENSVYFAPIEADGRLGFWTPASFLPDTCIDHEAVAIQDYLLVIGGRDVNEYYSDPTGQGTFYEYDLHESIQLARIQDDGSLSEWQVYKGLPPEIQEGIMRFSVATSPTFDPTAIYLVAGSTGQAPELTCDPSFCSAPDTAPYIRTDDMYVLNFTP